ncbi:MAG: AtpZ/AtpI family protein [Anaerolineales bacterium]
MEEQPDQQADAARASLELAFRVIAQIGGLTLAVILVSIFGGLFLDRLLDTKPLFTIILIVGSFPISMYVIYRVALGAVGKINPAAGRPRAKKEMRSDDDPTA